MKGTLLVFDEWKSPLRGYSDDLYRRSERKAFFEWVEKFDIKYDFIQYDGEDVMEQAIVIVE